MKTIEESVLHSYFYRYHGLTKHTVEKLFASGRSLDWANQPDPFRRYEGAEVIKLPTKFVESDLSYFELPAPHAVPMSLQFISSLLYYSFAISAWKQVVGTNSKWALRVNPSSGNLHPTEVHLLFDSVYHYAVKEHALEKRCTQDLRSLIWNQLGLDEADLPPLLICLSSIFWREAWKYETRAFRYCQHDLGHALGALEVSAQLHGWSTLNFSLFDDERMTSLLGLNETQEHPLAFVALYPHKANGEHMRVSSVVQGVTRDTPHQFRGQANFLSEEQIKYPPIEKVFESTCYDKNKWIEARNAFVSYDIESMPNLMSRMLNVPENEIEEQSLSVIFPQITKKKKAQEIIRTRRSAVDMDGVTSASKEVLDTILLSSTKGFDADFQTRKNSKKNSGFNLIHLFLYIHRVENVTPGLYYFDRYNKKLVALRVSDQRHFARTASCFQDIASDGIFAVSMVADFNTGMEVFGERCYRLLHYEAGYIGQHFYLASHALGVDATGIGCFVDDAINKYIDLPKGYEVIYNFTFGAAVHDPRLTTLPSYDFEK